MRAFLLLLACATLLASHSHQVHSDQVAHPPIDTFLLLAAWDPDQADQAEEIILENWDDAYTSMLVELHRYVQGVWIQRRIIDILERGTGERLGHDPDRWWDWIWRTDPGTHPDYADFKATLYAYLDPSFEEYFDYDPPANIRLDEIRWGGVPRDGIPPLDHPKMISTEEADYLDDDNVVFGIALDGDARAYPKRILAWHEMFKDSIAGEHYTGVYCTLCGTMILYRSAHQGAHHELGTSGFLYRSNKLMYDHATRSLWSTFAGEPAVGPLVGRGIELERRYVVTTTWGEWRRRHPGTQVLSLDTGHERDYREGMAYRDYFASDRLMFTVPELDDRLDNKGRGAGAPLPRSPPASSSRSRWTSCHETACITTPSARWSSWFSRIRAERAASTRARAANSRTGMATVRSGEERRRVGRRRGRADRSGRRAPGAAPRSSRVLVRLVRAIPGDTACPQ